MSEPTPPPPPPPPPVREPTRMAGLTASSSSKKKNSGAGESLDVTSKGNLDMQKKAFISEPSAMAGVDPSAASMMDSSAVSTTNARSSEMLLADSSTKSEKEGMRIFAGRNGSAPAGINMSMDMSGSGSATANQQRRGLRGKRLESTTPLLVGESTTTITANVVAVPQATVPATTSSSTARPVTPTRDSASRSLRRLGQKVKRNLSPARQTGAADRRGLNVSKKYLPSSSLPLLQTSKSPPNSQLSLTGIRDPQRDSSLSNSYQDNIYGTALDTSSNSNNNSSNNNSSNNNNNTATPAAPAAPLTPSTKEGVRILPRKVQAQVEAARQSAIETTATNTSSSNSPMAASVKAKVPASAGLRQNLAPSLAEKTGERIITKKTSLLLPGAVSVTGADSVNSHSIVARKQQGAIPAAASNFSSQSDDIATNNNHIEDNDDVYDFDYDDHGDDDNDDDDDDSRHCSDACEALLELVQAGTISLNDQEGSMQLNAQELEYWKQITNEMNNNNVVNKSTTLLGAATCHSTASNFDVISHLVETGTIQLDNQDGTIHVNPRNMDWMSKQLSARGSAASMTDSIANGKSTAEDEESPPPPPPEQRQSDYNLLLQLVQDGTISFRDSNRSEHRLHSRRRRRRRGQRSNHNLAASQMSYDQNGRSLTNKMALPDGVDLPGAYSGTPGTNYNRLDSPRSDVLGQSVLTISAPVMADDECHPMPLDDPFASSTATTPSEAPRSVNNNDLAADKSSAFMDLEPTQQRPPKVEEGIEEEEFKEKAPSKNMWFIALAVLVVIVVVVVVVVVVGGNKVNTEPISDPMDEMQGANPDASSPTAVDFDPILLPGLPAMTVQAIKDDSQSPQALAYSWVAQDPKLDRYTDSNKLQRFALATFYYAFDGSKWPLDNEQSTNWLKYDLNECDWFSYGNACNEAGQVRLLNITQLSRFQGFVPPEIALLEDLEVIDLSGNILNTQLDVLLPLELFSGADLRLRLKQIHCSRCRLEGSIPPQISHITDLQELVLSENSLTGNVPSEMGVMTLLKNFLIMNNQLTGSLPSEVGLMTSLERLGLTENQLSSQIPSEIGNLKNLRFLALAYNAFSATLPTTLGMLSSLVQADMESNFFSGSLPTELGLLSRILVLDFLRSSVTGTLPSELGMLSTLKHFGMSACGIDGPIPTELGGMTSATLLDLSLNALVGTIPSELGRLTSLNGLFLDRNNLSGPVPSEIQALPGYSSFTF